ncbi:hypothetical protein B5T_02673 [Alloalcanivorax dieselolei B5]|uniref:DUF4328 domain-containing protein n=1 Tax=Alcanivorax dieselolei (strain DSM 16502 / CGMCC 1.3690 / MCCC 1A00001 / B-5) TaxID=930169 RepID=K0CE92_ALCDB|nr:DUF4328 domain-containing protein [Alloalcanivorax dieselolei]AFT70943.1 hypothetical protein B5T_02673 [Alloalcanivorax dieselolei B5]GGK01399.1 hypothetical protein GCM10007426_33070 [Alloalcanivorax dieselolei]
MEQGSPNQGEGTPYAPPRADLSEKPLQPEALIDTGGLTKWAIRLLYADMAMAAVAVISGLLEYRLLIRIRDGVVLSDQAIQTTAIRQGVVGLVQTLVLFTAVILVARWIYRANQNCRRLGARDMRFTPGWAVGWYFIPVLSMWKPFQAMKEIWRASAAPADWRRQSTPMLMPVWWGMWLLSLMLGSAIIQLARHADSVDDYLLLGQVTLVADFLEIPLAFALIVLIRRIHAMQRSGAMSAEQAWGVNRTA